MRLLEGAQLLAGLTQLTSALLLAGLGVFALWLKPRTSASVVFGVYALAYGYHQAAFNVLFIVGSTSNTVPAVLAVSWSRVIAYVVMFFAVIALVFIFPRRLERDARWMLVPGALVAGAELVLSLLAMPSNFGPSRFWLQVTGEFYLAALIGLMIVIACRLFRSRDADERVGLAFASAAFIVDPASRLGASLISGAADGTRSGFDLAAGLFTLLLFLALAVIFLAATRGPSARVARNVALLGPAAIVFAAILAAADWPALSYQRFLMVALFAYAIVRHRLLGVEVHLPARVLKAALGAFLIGGVFVASETVQQLIGERLGNAYVGIFAAGAVVLAIAPLSRLADRWGEPAIPTTAAPLAPPLTGSQNEEVYRNALRVALRDKRLTREEEIHLHRLASTLGIPAGRAHEMLVQVEREAGTIPG